MGEFERVNIDMSNLLSNTDISIVFLDAGFRIQWFTPATTRLLSLLSTDVGRPFTDIAQRFTDPDLLRDAQQVLQTLTPADKEIPGSEGQWWLRRISPYRTLSNQSEGVVITFTDVTGVKVAAERQRRLATLLMDSNDAIMGLDLEGRITAWNRGAELLEACRQARAWQRAGLSPVPVAVNLSAIQFRQPKLPDTVAKILQETELAPQYLELELTESMLMQQVEAGLASVQRLWALGLRLSIDDFGTGYSSLSYLRRFSIHRLKIDVSFLRDITTDPGAAAITSAIIAMGKSLKLRVLAEGVETRDQLALLQAQGCDEIQGDYFSRPLPADELAKLLREARTLPLLGS